MKVTSILVSFYALLLCSPCNGGFFGFKNKKKGGLDDVPTAALSNGQEFPLVGMGVGNLPADMVTNMISEGLKGDKKIRLFDTAHKSENEKLVADGIVAGVKYLKESEKTLTPVEVHVVTKVWYTHLGYERTKLAVKESLAALEKAIKDPNVDLKVHFMLHWPRCYEGIPWMNCELEENQLPDSVKNAGPPPHLSKDSWKESWKSLEDLYNSGDFPSIASIGVSNFKSEDMDALVKMARVLPHMVQVNVWSILNDPQLVDLCNKSDVHIQVYNVMNGIISNSQTMPHARHHLLMVADQINSSGTTKVTANQVVLKWLIQNMISVVPRTSNVDRLKENSAVSLAAFPDLTEAHSEIVAHAVEALLSGTDLPEDVDVKVTFHAKSQDMVLFYYPGPTDEEEKIIAYIKKGDAYEESTHPKHTFRLYSATDPYVYKDHTVEGNYGEHQHIHVDL